MHDSRFHSSLFCVIFCLFFLCYLHSRIFRVAVKNDEGNLTTFCASFSLHLPKIIFFEDRKRREQREERGDKTYRSQASLKNPTPVTIPLKMRVCHGCWGACSSSIYVLSSNNPNFSCFLKAFCASSTSSMFPACEGGGWISGCLSVAATFSIMGGIGANN